MIILCIDSFEDAARQAFLDIAEEWEDDTLFKGAYNPWTEWRSMGDACGGKAQDAVISRVHEPDVIVAQTPYAGAVETLGELVDSGYTLLYISNRKPLAESATRAWLNDWGFPHTEGLICTMKDKIPLTLGCRYIIDDRPKTLVQFVYNYTWRLSNPRKGRMGFGLAFPFNQNLTDVPDVLLAPTWGGIRYYLKKKGVLDGE